MPYRTGEEPKIDDVVEATLSMKSQDEIIEGEVYKVVRVEFGCVLLRGQELNWDSAKFNLITR